VFESLPRLKHWPLINIGRWISIPSGLLLLFPSPMVKLANRLMHPSYQMDRDMRYA